MCNSSDTKIANSPGIQQFITDCNFNLGQMFQFGYGVERDSKLSVKYYKRAAMMGKHVKAYQKCGDYYYSINDKRSAMTFYRKAAELGDL
jgi:TPR repeat protein|tara:strand:+ start:132 stop:401 length:270 start_codon:yes stop_codon:yes gene_type:complete